MMLSVDTHLWQDKPVHAAAVDATNNNAKRGAGGTMRTNVNKA